MQILNESEVLARLNAALAHAGAPPVTRQTFAQSIRPLMAAPERGEARPLSEGRRTMWAYDGGSIWEWEQYVAVRAVLIQRGEWSSKRPYSVADMESITRLEAHADVWDSLSSARASRSRAHESAP